MPAVEKIAIALAAAQADRVRRPERHSRVAVCLMAQDEGALFVGAVAAGEIVRGVALEARRHAPTGVALVDPSEIGSPVATHAPSIA
jgi:hypothetical protein